MTRVGSRREVTPLLAAYHEAGHAVACYFRPEAGRTIRITIRRSELEEGDAGVHWSASPPGPAAEPMTGASVGRMSMRNGVVGGNARNSGMSTPRRRAVSGVPSSSLMLVTSRPHSVCALRSWLKPSEEMQMPRS